MEESWEYEHIYQYEMIFDIQILVGLPVRELSMILFNGIV